jgi:MFS family permease
VSQGEPWIAVAGFGLVGAGLSSMFPTLVAAAGRTPGGPASSATAAVSSIGYTGFLAGPPLIGMIGEALSLRAGVAAIGLAGLLIAALGGILAPTRTRAKRRGQPDSAPSLR